MFVWKNILINELILAVLGLHCCTLAFLWLRRAGATLWSLWLRRAGATLWSRRRASRCRGSSCGVQALERGLQKLWYRSLAALKHMESSRSRDRIPVPALPSRFLTPGPPGKSEEVFWLFHFIFWLPYGMWELSSLTREQTWVPAVEAQSPNHWTTGESPCFVLFLIKKKKKCTLSLGP